MNKGWKFLKKLWCCVGGGNKVIWLYQLSWKCKLATVTSYKADVSSVSPSSERNNMFDSKSAFVVILLILIYLTLCALQEIAGCGHSDALISHVVWSWPITLLPFLVTRFSQVRTGMLLCMMVSARGAALERQPPRWPSCTSSSLSLWETVSSGHITILFKTIYLCGHGSLGLLFAF